jgi:hypothetical protein
VDDPGPRKRLSRKDARKRKSPEVDPGIANGLHGAGGPRRWGAKNFRSGALGDRADELVLAAVTHLPRCFASADIDNRAQRLAEIVLGLNHHTNPNQYAASPRRSPVDNEPLTPAPELQLQTSHAEHAGPLNES